MYVCGLKMKSIKRIFVVLIISFLLVYVYYIFFASKPEKTIELYVSAINEANYDQFINCFEPKVQKASEGILGLGSSIFGVDIKNILNITPMFLPALGSDYKTYKLYDVKVVEYEGKLLKRNFSSSSMFNDIVGCFMGEKAMVEFVIISNNSEESSRCRMELRKYGMKWLIPEEGELIILD